MMSTIFDEILGPQEAERLRAKGAVVRLKETRDAILNSYADRIGYYLVEEAVRDAVRWTKGPAKTPEWVFNAEFGPGDDGSHERVSAIHDFFAGKTDDIPEFFAEAWDKHVDSLYKEALDVVKYHPDQMWDLLARYDALEDGEGGD